MRQRLVGLIRIALRVGRTILAELTPQRSLEGKPLLVAAAWTVGLWFADKWRDADDRRLAAWVRGVRRLERRNRGEAFRAEPTPREWGLRAAHHEGRAAALRIELKRLRAAGERRVRFPYSRKRRLGANSTRSSSVDETPTSENDPVDSSAGRR